MKDILIPMFICVGTLWGIKTWTSVEVIGTEYFIMVYIWETFLSSFWWSFLSYNCFPHRSRGCVRCWIRSQFVSSRCWLTATWLDIGNLKNSFILFSSRSRPQVRHYLTPSPSTSTNTNFTVYILRKGWYFTGKTKTKHHRKILDLQKSKCSLA